ncbi:prolyl oligopeptidase family serine peptidase [Leptotrichia sp. oral taxon 417]|uniref:prolyl oligopeptidase family serine peptidase n=1 Tax=Leptotrichia sp. oral taxon 417 TaxID=712365 RepID=UPI0015BDCAF3|nr:prolyl oligopeptidase family serine peptidase [Leptotrichia sp. oral taxon 417]NWO28252.1 prolyl oligopeptidase family serine peptidase [Leptotrichia sp. oral taxon 417]
MKTKVLVFVGLFLVSVLGISSEIPFPTIPIISYSLNAKVFDYGQNIVSIEIDTKGQGENIPNKQIDKDTFKVFAKGTLPKDAGIVLDDKTKSLGTFEVEREIENIYVNDKGNIVINLKYGKDVVGANTLSYVTGDVSRNVLMDLEYRVDQKKKIKDYKTGFHIQGKIVDEEADKFVAAKSKSGVNYQYFKPVNKDDGKKHPLIIWFHGNGEGGYKDYQNNVSQKLANRGAVAFAEDKTQKIFGGAYVVAPQADDTWYNNYTKGYIKSVKAMIDEFVSENNIDKNRIYIFGASAGGYMSFRMMIDYPDYFAAFSTSAAALDKAATSGGVATTTQDLMKIRNKPLWMVHAKNDPTISYENTSKRVYDVLSKYGAILSSYPNVKIGETEYNGHWSWIYSLRNMPVNDKGEHLFEWMARQNLKTRYY